MLKQRWWVDAKRRSATVSAGDVKSVAVNSVAFGEVDYIVIATNTFFSNPTRDWVAARNKQFTRPIVKLWDRNKLQELVDKYPSAAAKAFTIGLSFEDRNRFLSDFFFERGRPLNVVDLRRAWADKDRIRDARFLVVACHSELTGGDIEARPWGALFNPMIAIESLIYSYTALVICAVHNDSVDLDDTLKTAAYVTASATVILPAPAIAEVLKDPYRFIGGKSPPDTHFIRPSLQFLAGQLLECCADDCARYSMSPTRGAYRDIEDYWRRYRCVNIEGKGDRLTIVNRNIPCAVGLDVTDVDCPLDVDEFGSIESMVEIVKSVIGFRLEHPNGQLLKHSPVRLDNSVVQDMISKIVEEARHAGDSAD
jgi:hypothetical protein